MSLLPSQCRAARALLEMGTATLACRAVVVRDVVVDFEGGIRTPSASNIAAIRAALEAAGVIIIDETDDVGPGVRLRKLPWPKSFEQKICKKGEGCARVC